ncbi:conserved hypothetical protein [Ricinus communis]|uniref:Uncharacterized protein n=1 Tax=Ricinus communis TaxID=3988 RepID=B9RK50_RICCO|nr:conserved hypothetical protein [Ricinus communis]
MACSRLAFTRIEGELDHLQKVPPTCFSVHAVYLSSEDVFHLQAAITGPCDRPCKRVVVRVTMDYSFNASKGCI